MDIHYFESIHQLIEIWVVSTSGYYDVCYYKHLCTKFCVDIWFQFPQVCISEWNYWINGNAVFNF